MISYNTRGVFLLLNLKCQHKLFFYNKTSIFSSAIDCVALKAFDMHKYSESKNNLVRARAFESNLKLLT